MSIVVNLKTRQEIGGCAVVAHCHLNKPHKIGYTYEDVKFFQTNVEQGLSR